MPTLKLKKLPLRARSLEARPSLQAPLEKNRGAACLVEEGELGALGVTITRSGQQELMTDVRVVIFLSVMIRSSQPLFQ